MKHSCSCKTKALVSATVLSNEKLGPRIFRITLQLKGLGAKAFADFKPGQFAQFEVRDLALPAKNEIPADMRDKSRKNNILRRPFSFYNVEIVEDSVILRALYLVLGAGTLRLSTIAASDEISLVGPLGNGFWMPENKKLALILAGGMGAPPLQHLGTYLAEKHPKIRVIAFAGARSKADLPFYLLKTHAETELSFCLEEFARYNIESHIATDDGSVGYKGFVTDLLQHWLTKNNIDPAQTIIYTCGPDPMLASVAKLAANLNIDCQVSTERVMGCGFGVCQSCAIECYKPGTQEKIYKLCCTDGPVFDSREVVWK